MTVRLSDANSGFQLLSTISRNILKYRYQALSEAQPEDKLKFLTTFKTVLLRLGECHNGLVRPLRKRLNL